MHYLTVCKRSQRRGDHEEKSTGGFQHIYKRLVEYLEELWTCV